jgi:hypothetical protein
LALDFIFDIVGLPNLCKNAIRFFPFQLVHEVEAFFPIECEIPSLNISIELLLDTTELEEHFVYLENIDEKQ